MKNFFVHSIWPQKGLWLFSFFWLGLLLFLLFRLEAYKSTAGPSTTGNFLPISFQNKFPNHKKFIFGMFVHPSCPCSRASLKEALKIKTQLAPQTEFVFFMYTPARAPAHWNESKVLELIEQFPQHTLVNDSSGYLAKQFGASTSGQTFLASQQGKILFAGGITFSRGHEGANLGSESIKRLVAGEPKLLNQVPIKTKVFGCILFNDQKETGVAL